MCQTPAHLYIPFDNLLGLQCRSTSVTQIIITHLHIFANMPLLDVLYKFSNALTAKAICFYPTTH